jgi:hypothetical protein
MIEKNNENNEKERKHQWKMMKQRENTNEKWWNREKTQWKMMKNRETTRKNDEK